MDTVSIQLILIYKNTYIHIYLLMIMWNGILSWLLNFCSRLSSRKNVLNCFEEQAGKNHNTRPLRGILGDKYKQYKLYCYS